MMNTYSAYTASEARKNFYELLRSAGKGLRSYEIKLRGSDPVVLINKSDIEAWQETLDILSNSEEIQTIRKAKKQNKLISLTKLINNTQRVS